MQTSPRFAPAILVASLLLVLVAPAAAGATQNEPRRLRSTHSAARTAARPARPAAGPNTSATPQAVLVASPQQLVFPSHVDSNSPAHWDGTTMYLFNSLAIGSALPARSTYVHGQLTGTADVVFENDDSILGNRWIEATYKADDGTLYGWYHEEQDDLCPPLPDGFPVAVPHIGALVSHDNGATWTDLGIVLAAPAGDYDCAGGTLSMTFAGGVGDFSVILDSAKQYFYFLYSAYSGDISQQGVAVARMPYASRDNPAGQVWKWYQGAWSQPGVGGLNTPIFQAVASWSSQWPDAYWGPSIHWNTHLQQYVILMNHANGGFWSQEGIYVTFNRDVSNPNGWSTPREIVVGGDWYPQVLGRGGNFKGTDKLASGLASYVQGGISSQDIAFLKPGEALLSRYYSRSVSDPGKPSATGDSWATIHPPGVLYSFQRALGIVQTKPANTSGLVQLEDCYYPNQADHEVQLGPTTCPGGLDMGSVGWVASPKLPQPDGTVPLYLCLNVADSDHSVSTAPDCEGHGVEVAPLGYAWR